MRNVVDIIGDVVESLTQTIAVDSVEAVGNTFVFSVSRTYWARPHTQNSLATNVVIDGITYHIHEMVYNESITVHKYDQVDLSDITELTLAAPIYINGTRRAVNKERRGLNSPVSCPFVWLVEPFVASENPDIMSIVESEPDLTVVFLDNNMQDDWTTADHYEKVITPMMELAAAFKAKVRETRGVFGKIRRWDAVSRAVYGVESANGAISSILNERTSGVEVRFTVEILKSFNTCN